MAEPTTTGGISLTVLFIAFLGPLVGPYALIVFAALAGSLWPLSSTDADPSAPRRAGAALVLRCTLTSVALTAFIAGLLGQFWQISATESLAPVALLLAAMGNGWRAVFGALSGALVSLLAWAGRGGAKNEQ